MLNKEYSPKSMFWFIAVFFAPLLLNLIALKLAVEVVLLDYIFAIGLILSTIFSPRQRTHIVIQLFKWICLLYVAIGFVDILREGQGIRTYLARHYGVFVALGIVYYFEMITPYDARKIVTRFGNFAGLMFLIQLIYSIYESSVSVVYLVDSYDWNTTAKGTEEIAASQLVNRLQIDFFLNNLHIPFHSAFSGLLGQHNHWGTQLPFYFLLFGFIYFFTQRKNKRFIFFMVLVPIAALLNTSRFGMISIAISGIFFFFVLSTFSRRFKKFIVVFILGILVVYIGIILDTISEYIALTDTFSGRIEVWVVLIGFVSNNGIVSNLLGISFKQLQFINQKLNWLDFENLGFTLIFGYGIPYVILFVAFLGFIFERARLLKQPQKIIATLLVVNIVFVSAWSNVLFRYSSFGLVTVILCCVFLPMEQGDIDTYERTKEIVVNEK